MLFHEKKTSRNAERQLMASASQTISSTEMSCECCSTVHPSCGSKDLVDLTNYLHMNHHSILLMTDRKLLNPCDATSDMLSISFASNLTGQVPTWSWV